MDIFVSSNEISKCQLSRTANVPLMNGHAVNRKFRWDVLGKQKLLENSIKLQSLNSGMRSPYSSKATILFIFIPLIFSGENEASTGTNNVLKKLFLGFRDRNYVDESNYTYIILHKGTDDDETLSYVNNHGYQNDVNKNNEAVMGGGILNTLFENFYNNWRSMYNNLVAANGKFYKHIRDFADDVSQRISGLRLFKHANLCYDKLFNSKSSENGLSGGTVSESIEREVEFTSERNTEASDSGSSREKNSWITHQFWNQKWNWWNISDTRENAAGRIGVNNSQIEYTNYTDNETDKSVLDNITVSVNVYNKGLNESDLENNITDSVENAKDYLHNMNVENGISVNADVMSLKHEDEELDVYDREPHNIFSRVTKEGISDGAVPNAPHDAVRSSQKYNTYIDLKSKILKNENNDGSSEKTFNAKFIEATVNDKYGSNMARNDGMRNYRHERLRLKGLDSEPDDLYEAKKITKREASYSGVNENRDRLSESDRKRVRLKYRGINKADVKQRDEYIKLLNDIVNDPDGTLTGNNKRTDGGNKGNNNKYKERSTSGKATDDNEDNSDKERLKDSENWETLREDDTDTRRREFKQRKKKEERPSSDSGGTLSPNGTEESMKDRSRSWRVKDDGTSNYKGENGSYRDSSGWVSSRRLDSERQYNSTELRESSSVLDKCSISSVKGLIKKCVSKIKGFFQDWCQTDETKIPVNETSKTS